MRPLHVLLLSASLCANVAAQTPADAAAKPAATAQTPSGATARFKELGEQNVARMRKVPRGDNDARTAAMNERKSDLEAFVKEFAKSAEANKAHLELAQIAMTSKDAAAGKAALAAIDVAQLDMASAIRSAMVAKALDLGDEQRLFLDNAKAKAKSIDDRFEMVNALRQGMKDDAAADALMAEIEASAKTDDDKASVALNKATLVRRTKRDDKAAYADALGEVAKLYPNTKAGKAASSKLAAAKLAPGSDPVAFTTKDIDGKDVSPADYKGKVLLIDFWATWCGPCMAELPHVLEAYGEFHDKGFEILGISLDRDTDKDKLLSTIKDRGMSWRHVYDGKFWQAEIAQLHDVNSIPFTILIGKDGKVVGTNLRGKALGEAVKTALAAK